MTRTRRSAALAFGLVAGLLVVGAVDLLIAGPGLTVIFGAPPAVQVRE